MTKSELYTLIQQYLENSETSFVGNLDIFVQLCEEDIFKQVQLLELRKNSTSAFDVGSPYLGTPSDFLAPYSMAVVVAGQYQFLMQKDVSFIREAFPAPSFTGVPQYYSMFDENTFIIAPCADSAYQVELHYFYEPQSITALGDSGTTWLSINAENTLLYGSLYHGYIYMKGDADVIQFYKDQYDKSMASLKIISEGRARKDSYRTSDRRIPV